MTHRKDSAVFGEPSKVEMVARIEQQRATIALLQAVADRWEADAHWEPGGSVLLRNVADELEQILATDTGAEALFTDDTYPWLQLARARANIRAAMVILDKAERAGGDVQELRAALEAS